MLTDVEAPIGARIRDARVRASLSIEDLAARARCSRNYIAALERGMEPGRTARSRGSVERILHVLALALPDDDVDEAAAIVGDEAHA